MQAETYTKFYVFMALALVLGFAGMEVATTGVALRESELTGMALHGVADAGTSLTGSGTPGSNLIFLLIGVVAGAVIVGTAVYIYSVEKK
jgi:hypothetical protein